jgi:hypothetical protein
MNSYKVSNIASNFVGKQEHHLANKVFIKTAININTIMNNFLSIIQNISLPNKYTKWYIHIISNTKTQSTYTEKHHIVPKSFAKILNIENINDPENLAQLTAREHFVCHLLLTKMFQGKFKQKMFYAIHRLTYSNNGRKADVYVSSRHYEQIRKQHSENLTGEGNPMFGKLHNNQTKEKISKMAKGRKASDETKLKMSAAHSGPNNHMFGRTHTEEARRKISEGNKGIGAGENNNFYGKTHSDETKQRLSEVRKSQPKLQCPYCNKLVDPSNYKRWHGDKCKSIFFQNGILLRHISGT